VLVVNNVNKVLVVNIVNKVLTMSGDTDGRQLTWPSFSR
jgi:hypothetical protein